MTSHARDIGREECAEDGCELGASVVVDGEHLCGAHAKERVDG